MKSLGDIGRCEVREEIRGNYDDRILQCPKDGICVKEIMEISEFGRRFRYRFVCGDHGLRDYLNQETCEVKIDPGLFKTIFDFLLIQDVFDT